MPFLFENLNVYQKALTWVKDVENLCRASQGQTSPGLLNQLSRASLSIPLNIAEGNGRWHKAEKRQFYWIARGSVFECVAVIQVLKSCDDLEEAQFSKFLPGITLEDRSGHFGGQGGGRSGYLMSMDPRFEGEISAPHILDPEGNEIDAPKLNW